MFKRKLASFLIALLMFGFVGVQIGCDGDGDEVVETPSPSPTPPPPPPPPPPSPDAEFQPGDIIPGFVLTRNSSGGIADVRTVSTYVPDNSTWQVLFIRALTTPDVEGDVQFDFTNPDNLYLFSIMYLDNTGVTGPISAASAVMSTQDTAPYSIGNESSAADLKAVNETPSNCSEFTGDPLVTSPNDPAVVPELTLWAAYDAVNVYLCVEAPDPNDVRDDLKQHWEFIGPGETDWERKAGIKNIMSSISDVTDMFDEDRIAIWFDINAQLFSTLGCFALCHDTRMQSINPDGRADLWHWKAARTDLPGFAEDQRLDPDISKCPDNPCRQTDTAISGIASNNIQTVDSIELPAFMAEDDPGANAFFLFEDEIPPDCPAGDCALAVPFIP